MNRTLYRWKVTLQAQETGEVVDHELAAYWDPEHETTEDGVACAARAAAWWQSGQRVHYAPVAVELLSGSAS